ncbi:MAG: hypothetical protein EAX90_07885 [Candidatus Heimdallarchaeota archaeon]|nr:hypothetical protein [Candidatus Heimdallarchaeota archaeon]
MKNYRVNRLAIILSLFVITSSFLQFFAASGETYTLVNEQFFIPPQQPEVIAEDTFNLTDDVEYVIGIPITDAIGGRSETNSYYFEMESTDRVEVYFLDSSEYYGGDVSDYEEYADSWSGIGSPAPTVYVHRIICDGYIQQEFNFTGTSITPSLILYSNQTDVSGKYFWSEGLDETIYTPYYIHSVASDRETTDLIHIFYVNGSIDAYILSDFQFLSWKNNINNHPLSSLDSASGVNLTLEFTASEENDVHLLIWHKYLHDGINGSLIWNYEYQRTFGENYWSLFLVIFLIIIFVLSFVFQKQVLPPIVWTFTKTKYYLWTIPWKYIKKAFVWLGSAIAKVWRKMRGIQEDIDEEDFKEKPAKEEEKL